ncbi:MAG: prephenate dehydrogenase/arogenate dehydrogenase family protein [Pseudomonadales bacterium]|nr:prephenate dehydrogenase/arogenate dehydrogenase family protein [Pseudomonadales bacterium]
MKRMLLVGTGLIGSSFALALKKANLVDNVVGVDTSAEALKEALDAGIIETSIFAGALPAGAIKHASAGAAHEESLDSDLENSRYLQELAATLVNIQIIVIAVPVSAIADVVVDIFATELAAGCVVFDMGSVKQSVITGVRDKLGQLPPAFVPVHPIAGSERHGATAARADLFFEHRVVMTPEPETGSWAVEQVRHLWTACGATVCELDAASHDQILAATSHLPHFIAFGFMSWLERSHSDNIFQYAAGGLRDFSRISGSDAQVWTSIFEENASELLPQIDELLVVLQDLKLLIENNNSSELSNRLDSARLARLDLLKAISVKS